MTTTEERPAPKGATELQNIRVPRPTWDAAAEPCKKIAGKGGRSQVARDALEKAIRRDGDPTWEFFLQLAVEREMTPAELEDYVVEQYVTKVQRDRAGARKRRTPAQP